MSISGKALRRLEKAFDDVCLCRDRLVVRPTEHIVRGFVFERTPYKGLFYFWRFVRPLYSPRSFLIVGHGQRLAGGDYIDLGEANFEASVQHLIEIISHSELDHLRGIRRPEDFLAEFRGPSSSGEFTPGISAYDAALTFYLMGRTTLCVRILEDFASQDMTRGSVDLQRQARNLLLEMRRDPSAAKRNIDALERASIEYYHLAPALSPAFAALPQDRSQVSGNSKRPLSRSTKGLRAETLKLLQQAFPALALCYDMLVVPPTEHMLRCFLFESHPETGGFYFWRVVMPLYRPVRIIILNYGERLLGGELIEFAECDIERLARAISDQFEYLHSFRTPNDFLRRIDWNLRPATPNYRLDFALTHYLAGNVSTCLEILETIVSQEVRAVWAETINLARDIAEEMKADRAALDRRLEAWRTSNVEIFCLSGRGRRRAPKHADRKQSS